MMEVLLTRKTSLTIQEFVLNLGGVDEGGRVGFARLQMLPALVSIMAETILSPSARFDISMARLMYRKTKNGS